MLGAVKTAYAKYKGKGPNNEIWKKLTQGTRMPNGHYGAVNFLREVDSEFEAGSWYEKHCVVPGCNKQNFFTNRIAELQYNDRENDDVDEKFIWEWCT